MDENTEKVMIAGGGYGHGYLHAVIEVGKEYEILPLNPRRMKHRGRVCTFLGLVPISEFKPDEFVFKVRFKDNNRIGRLRSFDDLLLSAIKQQS